MTDTWRGRLYYSGSLAWMLMLPVSILAHLLFLVSLPHLGKLTFYEAPEVTYDDPPAYEVELIYREPEPLAAPQDAQSIPEPQIPEGTSWEVPYSTNPAAPPPPVDLPEVAVPPLEELDAADLDVPDPVLDEAPEMAFRDNPMPPGDLLDAAPPDELEGEGADALEPGMVDDLEPVADIDVPAAVIDPELLPEGLTVTGQITHRITPPPPLPQPEEGKDVTIRLRFSVRPDGYVVSPVVIQKGDPELERLAMDFLRRWRFSPLRGGVDPVNQVGEITIRMVTVP